MPAGAPSSPGESRMSFPIHLTDWKVGRLILLWPDKSVSTKAISRELDLGAADAAPLCPAAGARPPADRDLHRKEESQWPAVRFEPLLELGSDPEPSDDQAWDQPLK